MRASGGCTCQLNLAKDRGSVPDLQARDRSVAHPVQEQHQILHGRPGGKLCLGGSEASIFASAEFQRANDPGRWRQRWFASAHQKALKASKVDLAEETDEGLTRWRKLGGGVLV
jgi:hypothetical protein